MANDSIKVHVRYIAAGRPYMADDPATTTVGQLKTAALAAFGLVEEGNKVFKLFLQKAELTNPNQTIGDLAGGKKELNFELEEFITQGK